MTWVILATVALLAGLGACAWAARYVRRILARVVGDWTPGYALVALQVVAIAGSLAFARHPFLTFAASSLGIGAVEALALGMRPRSGASPRG